MSPNRASRNRMSQRKLDREQRLFSFNARRWIWLALVMLEALIAVRIGLKLIGANPEILFAFAIYNVSYIFLFPFEGLVATPAAGRVVLELSSIIAMMVYVLLAWAIERTVWLFFYRPRVGLVGVSRATRREPDGVVQTTTREQHRE
jgi:hypothetical protein